MTCTSSGVFVLILGCSHDSRSLSGSRGGYITWPHRRVRAYYEVNGEAGVPHPVREPAMPSTTVKLVQDSRVLTLLHERDGAAEERTMATHMKALVDKVTIEPSLLTPLPESVAVALKRQATALQERLPLLDAELGLVYPPIDVLPVLMETPGNVGAIHARMSLKSFAGVTRIAVEMFAPSLIALADNQDLLDGTLAHEFLHYVWSTLRIAQWRALGHPDVLDLSAPPNYEALDENYKSLDHAAQVPVEGWLTPTSPVSHDARRGRDQRRIPFFAGVHRRWLDSARPAEQTVVPALQVQWEARDRCGHRQARSGIGAGADRGRHPSSVAPLRRQRAPPSELMPTPEPHANKVMAGSRGLAARRRLRGPYFEKVGLV